MRIVRGAPGTGKTSLVFREFKESLSRGREPRIVVPTATLVRHFQHELARDGVICRPRSVISLARFVSELAGESCRHAPPALTRSLVRASLKYLDLPAFAEAAKTDGMAAIVEETITLFENAGCSPDRLAARALAPRAKAFARVWTHVDRDLQVAGYRSRLTQYRTAIANARPMDLWFDGFLHFSQLEVELLEALGDVGQVVITASEDASQTLFDERTDGVPRRPAMVEVTAESVEREADDIARRILDLHAKGTPFREIGVAVRDAAVYEPLLRGVFERFGIPARFYFSKPLLGHPVASFIGGLIESALKGWDHRDALAALRADPRSGLSAAFDRFEFEVRNRLPDRGVNELLKVAALDGMGDYRKRLADCIAIRHWPEESLRPVDWSRRVVQLAEKLFLPGHIVPAVTFADVETARSQTAGLRAFIEAVTDIAVAWPGSEVEKARGLLTLAEFWEVARQSIRESGYRVPDERRDVVHVLSSYEARQWDVTALFVCGMTNRDYPKRASQNLLFPDTEIDTLRRVGIPLRRTSDLEEDEDKLWSELRCRARQGLVVSWPRHDAGGRTVEASRYLAERDSADTTEACIPAGGEPNRRGARGRIVDDNLLAAIAGAHPQMGVTAVEDLAQCRFKFFAGRTLGLRTPPERPEERLQPKVTGLIMHEALEEWLKSNRRADFVALFDEAFAKACREKHLPPGFRLEVERTFLRGIAAKVSTTEQWTPVETQAEVPFELPLMPGVNIKGRMDRIDRMNDTDCVIVDYKSGRTKRVESFIQNRAKLQGPLYALAAREVLGLRTIAMMYVAVREDKRFGWGAVPGANLELLPMPEDWIEAAQAMAVSRVEDLLDGLIEAKPTEEADCRFCDFREACHVKEDVRELVHIAGGAHA